MRVLVVEDEVKMARAIRRGMEQEGYAVDTALDGDEGAPPAAAAVARPRTPRRRPPGG